jgi:FRG domain
LVIEKLSIDTWDELVLTINDMFISYPDYIFRGQSQDNWKIESSMTRLLRDSELVRDFDAFYQIHLSNFKLKLRGHGFDLKNMNDDEIWAIGQHYGLATPLVDWTISPYVAIFFAITGKAKSVKGKRSLWAFNLTDLEKFKKKDKQLITRVEPFENNQRLFSQNGLFLKLPLNSDFESIVARQPKRKWVSLYKITFPDKIIEQALVALNLMNINYSSLYPDLQGASLNCNQVLKLYNYITDLQDENE